MKHFKFLGLAPICILVIGMLMLPSCNKEVGFENWLTRKGGKWKVASMTENEVEFAGTDSTVSETIASQNIGEFRFYGIGIYSFDFYSQVRDEWLFADSEWMTDDQRVSDSKVYNGVNGEYDLYQMSGWKESARRMNMLIRIELWNPSGIVLASNFDMVLERD